MPISDNTPWPLRVHPSQEGIFAGTGEEGSMSFLGLIASFVTITYNFILWSSVAGLVEAGY